MIIVPEWTFFKASECLIFKCGKCGNDIIVVPDVALEKIDIYPCGCGKVSFTPILMEDILASIHDNTITELIKKNHNI